MSTSYQDITLKEFIIDFFSHVFHLFDIFIILFCLSYLLNRFTGMIQLSY